MIGTTELAERLYVAWRERMEFVEPIPYGITTGGGPRQSTVSGSSPAYKQRPTWVKLTAQQQAVWRHVAEAAGMAVNDALGASQ